MDCPGTLQAVQVMLSEKRTYMYKYYLVTVLLMIKSLVAIGQLQKHQYEVFYNDKIAGKMMISKTGNEQYYTIKVRLNANLNIVLKNISIESQEEAIFENGILKHSMVLRKANGKIKANKQTKRTDSSYIIYDGTTIRSVPLFEIRSNLLSILFAEPANQQKVFSDNLQQNVKVSQQGAHTYQIALANGTFNLYTYKNGACSAIELNNGLIKLTLKRMPDPAHP